MGNQGFFDHQVGDTQPRYAQARALHGQQAEVVEQAEKTATSRQQRRQPRLEGEWLVREGRGAVEALRAETLLWQVASAPHELWLLWHDSDPQTYPTMSDFPLWLHRLLPAAADLLLPRRPSSFLGLLPTGGKGPAE